MLWVRQKSPNGQLHTPDTVHGKWWCTCPGITHAASCGSQTAFLTVRPVRCQQFNLPVNFKLQFALIFQGQHPAFSLEIAVTHFET